MQGTTCQEPHELGVSDWKTVHVCGPANARVRLSSPSVALLAAVWVAVATAQQGPEVWKGCTHGKALRGHHRTLGGALSRHQLESQLLGICALLA